MTTNELSYLPLDKFPEWADDERMNALFAPFRKESSNDQDSKSKVKFWSRAIHAYTKNKNLSSFSVFELEEAFERNHSKPRCLSVVVEALISSGELIPEEVFLKCSADTWGSWALNTFVKTPSSWMFSVLKNLVVSHSINVDTKFIHLQNVKLLGNFLLDHIGPDKENKPITFNEYLGMFKDNNRTVDETTAKHVLIYLYKNKKAAFHPQDLTKPPVLLKLSKHHVQNVTSQELIINSLKSKERYLTQEIKELEEKQKTVLRDIKLNLSNNRKQMAKTLLRKKKEIERIIEVRSNALVSIDGMLMRISDASMNAEMIEGYSMASDVLKRYRGDITEDKIMDAQDDLRDKIEQIQSLEEIISENIGNATLSDADLDAELEELLGEDEAEQLDQGLPDLSKMNLKDLPSETISTPPKVTVTQNGTSEEPASNRPSLL